MDQWFSLEPKRSDIHKAAAAQILHDRDFMFPPQFHQFLETHFSSESDDLVVAGVHIQQECGFRTDSSFIVRKVGPIGAAHLPETGAAPRHDVGDPE